MNCIVRFGIVQMINNRPIGVLTVDQQLLMTNLLCSLPIAQSSLRLQGKYIYYFSKHRKIDYHLSSVKSLEELLQTSSFIVTEITKSKQL